LTLIWLIIDGLENVPSMCIGSSRRLVGCHDKRLGIRGVYVSSFICECENIVSDLYNIVHKRLFLD
jgi:hypothetical protein